MSLWSLLAFGANAIKHGTSPIGTIFELVFLAMYLMTFLWAVRSPSNQTLQDKFARSVVIHSGS